MFFNCTSTITNMAFCKVSKRIIIMGRKTFHWVIIYLSNKNLINRCILCMDYDDYNGFDIFGCALNKTSTCYGNACYISKFLKKFI